VGSNPKPETRNQKPETRNSSNARSANLKKNNPLIALIALITHIDQLLKPSTLSSPPPKSKNTDPLLQRSKKTYSLLLEEKVPEGRMR